METNETPTTQNPPKKTKEYVIIGILAALLLGSVGYNFYQHQQSMEKIEYLNIDLKDTENAKILLQQELDNLTSEFEQTKMDLEVKDSVLSKRDAEIFDKQREIQSILNKENVTSDELKKAKRMITALNADIARFKQEIAILQEKNDSLVSANDTLLYKQTQLSGELTQQKQRADDNEAKMRSTFSVSNYQIKGLKVKNSGKEVETDKAKRIDKIRVSFDVDPNQWAKSGQSEIYIAIYKPDGTLGKFKDSSPGQLETWSSGMVDYSDKVSFNYEQGVKQNISFDWEEYDFPKGTYNINLYQNGLKIGQKSLELR
jgi:predicted  nucleic acid-binding Zn-ribbon protein